MNQLKQKTILLLLGCLFTQPIFANFRSSDPCDEFTGHWTGTWQNNTCLWKVDALGTKYNEVIRLQVTTTDGRPWIKCSGSSSFVLSGTCKDSKIELSRSDLKLTGTVFSGFMSLTNWYNEIQLNKI